MNIHLKNVSSIASRLIPELKLTSSLRSSVAVKRWKSSSSSEIKDSSASEIKDSSSSENQGFIKFSTSPAAKFRAREHFFGSEEPPPDYMKYHLQIYLSSIVIFLIYFGVLREENDYDAKVDRDLVTIFKEYEDEARENNRNSERPTGLGNIYKNME